jgi:DNA-binding CsgD family transcriptional regulator
MSAVIDLERGTLAGSSQAISRPATEPTGTVPAPAAEPLSRLQLSPSPTLIFEVDARGNPTDTSPPRRFDVRLVGSLRNRARGQRGAGAENEVSAVLIIKAMTPTRLLACVRAVTRGGGSVSPELFSQLMPLPDDSPPGFHPHELTARELAVLQMLADGMATREIAEELSYSERTVKNVVHDLLEKLNCRTRAHAVALAIRHGVI